MDEKKKIKIIIASSLSWRYDMTTVEFQFGNLGAKARCKEYVKPRKA